jgi:hypothetical protein
MRALRSPHGSEQERNRQAYVGRLETGSQNVNQSRKEELDSENGSAGAYAVNKGGKG